MPGRPPTTVPPDSLAAGDPLSRVAALDGVSRAVDGARAAVDKLLAHRVLRRGSAEVTAESTLRSARASAALEGDDIPLDELRARLSGEAVVSGEPDVAALGLGATVIGGAVRLHAGLGSLRSAWERAPRQALARMHVLAARGLVPDDELGRPREGDVPAADDPLGLGPAPPVTEAAARLGGLSDLLVAPTSAPAVVVAAVTHAELLALRPFGRVDGLVARAAARLVLVTRGLDPKALAAIEVGHVEAGDYAEAARAYLAGTADGLVRWLTHYAGAVELGARDSLAVCEAILRGS